MSAELSASRLELEALKLKYDGAVSRRKILEVRAELHWHVVPATDVGCSVWDLVTSRREPGGIAESVQISRIRGPVERAKTCAGCMDICRTGARHGVF